MTSEDVREELARIAPARECDRLAELSALFHSAGSLHLRGKGEWALHLDLASGAAARRAFSLLRDVEIRSEIRTYRRRAFDRATRYQLHVEGSDDALRVLVAAGVLDRRGRAARASAAASRRARLLPLGVPPRSVPRRGIALGRALASSRAAYGGHRVRGAARRARQRSGHEPRCRRAPDPCRRVREELGRDRVGARARRARPRRCSALEERAVVAATSGQANRRANADHANLVRTSRAAQRQLEAVRKLRAAGRLERLGDAAPRDRRAPPAPSDGIASRARVAHRSAGEQGGGAASPAPARGACGRRWRERASLDSASDRATRETEGRPWEFASASTGSAASDGTSSGRSTSVTRTSRSSR